MKLSLLAAGLVGLVASGAMAAPLLSITSTQGVPGSTASVAINYTADTLVTGFQFDLLFNTNYLQFKPIVPGNILLTNLWGTNFIGAGQFRFVVLTLDHSLVASGVIATMLFAIVTNAPDHDEPVTFTNVLATDAAGHLVVLPASNGVLSVVVPPRFSKIAPTNNAAMRLTLSGSTNRSYTIQATTNLAAPQWFSFTNVLTGTNTIFTDTTASNFPARFYRAVVGQ